MNEYKILEFYHANLQRPVFIRAGMIVGFQYDKSQEANVILSAGGIVHPVRESIEEIKFKIEQLNVAQPQGENNVQLSAESSASSLRKRKASKAGNRHKRA